MATVTVIQNGAAKANGAWPYTLVFVANPWIEAPERSGKFVADPIILNASIFDDRVRFALDSIFGRLAGQAETLFGQPGRDFRVISIFDDALPRADANALVAHDNTNIVVARQNRFAPFLKRYAVAGLGKIRADVALAITGSASHSRSSAWFTFDNDAAGGRDFRLDEAEMSHRFENLMPGAVALHVTAASIVPLHEFGHAASSWTNGMVTDLYVDGGDGINKRRGRPIAPVFCTYDGQAFASTATRGGGVDYPGGWSSYHCELHDPLQPAVMDDFWKASRDPVDCRHDKLTHRFLLDRIEAIMSR